MWKNFMNPYLNLRRNYKTEDLTSKNFLWKRRFLNSKKLKYYIKEEEIKDGEEEDNWEDTISIGNSYSVNRNWWIGCFLFYLQFWNGKS